MAGHYGKIKTTTKSPLKKTKPRKKEPKPKRIKRDPALPDWTKTFKENENED